MTAAITGGIGLASGLAGMIGGMRTAKQVSQPFIQTEGIAPRFYELSGQDQQAASRAEADSLGRQASLSYEQSLLEGAQKEREFMAYREEQSLRFASSGVTLQGSPLGVLEETRALGQQEADAIRRRGVETSGLLEMEGLQMLRRGSASAFSGFAQALQSKFETNTRNNQAKYESGIRSQQLKQQAFQSGLSGLSAGVQGIGSLFKK